MRRDEVARTYQPEHDAPVTTTSGLRAKRRENPRGPTAQFERRTLGDLVELLVLGERRGEPDAVDQFVVVVRDLGVFGQDSPGAVETVANEDQEESLESTRSPDLESQQLLVGEHLDLVALTTAFPNSSTVAKEPTPRAEDRARRGLGRGRRCESANSIVSITKSQRSVENAVRRLQPVATTSNWWRRCRSWRLAPRVPSAVTRRSTGRDRLSVRDLRRTGPRRSARRRSERASTGRGPPREPG